jgi:hypothetical protein
MWYHSVLDYLKSGSARTGTGRRRRVARRKRPATCKLLLELLEDRTVPSAISLVPSEAAPQLVGERITWTATVTDGPAVPVYQFSDGPADGPFHVARDFSPDNTFTWAPMQEGRYKIMVTVKDGFAGTNADDAVVSDVVNSRVTGSQAVITPTLNPLVALYSAPPCSAGTEHVEFSVASDQPSWRSTNTLACEDGKSENFLVAGMLPNTTYEMRHVLSDGTASAPLLFTTGAIPSTVNLPSFTVRQPPGPGSDLNQDMLFQQLAAVPSNYPEPFATDLAGHVTWYYDSSQAGFLYNRPDGIARLLPGGTVLLAGGDSRAPFPTSENVLREIDLAGNTLRETNIDAVNVQLTALGHNIISGFHHEAQRLPNGQTAVIGLTERTVNINGTPTNYIGDMILVLDKNLQVAWVWDAFDHLDVNRGPVLGEVVQPGSPEPSSAVPSLPAVDWLHTNTVRWSPADGNLVLSIRHQDWVIKIDYQGGKGDGHVIWRLGKDGDFTVNSTDPNPWFSHQHDAHYIDDSTLILFDNGNTRRASDPNAHNRGQVWKLDEQTMTATLVVNADLGVYSFALGAAQRLSNGNYSFDSGFQGQAPTFFAQSIEVRPDGSQAYVLEVNKREYRNYRIRTLYEGISDQLAVAAKLVQPATLAAPSPSPMPMTISATLPIGPAVATAPEADALVRVLLVSLPPAVVPVEETTGLTFLPLSAQNGPSVGPLSVDEGEVSLAAAETHGAVVRPAPTLVIDRVFADMDGSLFPGALGDYSGFGRVS